MAGIPTGTARVGLAIGGMTCASCAARVEKKLNRMDGVEATVNYATEKAQVTYREDLTVAELIATVEAPATPPRPPRPYAPAGSAGPARRPGPAPRRRPRRTGSRARCGSG